MVLTSVLAYCLVAGIMIAVLVGILLRFWRRGNAERERILSEDVLKHMQKCEVGDAHSTLQSIAGTLHITLDHASALADRMLARKLIYLTQTGNFRLTEEGREQAIHLLRAHRLWESYLADETGYAEKEWHERAEDYEHRLSRTEVASLSSSLGRPTHDPDGDPIPSEAEAFTEHGGKPLTVLSAGESARIVHIEDEPPIIYEGLARKGLHSGMQIRMKQISDKEVRVEADGDEHVLTPIEAANVSIATLPTEPPAKETSPVRLTDLRAGEYGQILAISPACRGRMRRRLMDLGFLPGTVVKAEMSSALGDPMAYRVRGVQVALRDEQSKLITIRRVES
jgi:DtxR family Mn-dependent transcriptional regulator